MSPPGGNPSLSLESPPAQSPTPATEGAASAEATAAKAAASPGAVVSAQATTPPSQLQGAAVSSPPMHVEPDSTPEATPETQSRDTLTLTLAAPPAPVAAGRTMSLTDVANALENHPDARPSDKLLALELRVRQDPALADQYVADAVQRFGNAAQPGATLPGNRRSCR